MRPKQNYVMLTNAELEDEIAHIKSEYNLARDTMTEQLELMKCLGEMYSEAQKVLNMRNGKG